MKVKTKVKTMVAATAIAMAVFGVRKASRIKGKVKQGTSE